MCHIFASRNMINPEGKPKGQLEGKSKRKPKGEFGSRVPSSSCDVSLLRVLSCVPLASCHMFTPASCDKSTRVKGVSCMLMTLKQMDLFFIRRAAQPSSDRSSATEARCATLQVDALKRFPPKACRRTSCDAVAPYVAQLRESACQEAQ